MKPFMNADFLLDTPTAKTLFAAAQEMPIFDWHCHLSPREIYENREPENITQLWLYGDHYKWRAMRSFGIAEKYVTGDASDKEKFFAFAKVMPYLIGNPMYHWSHLELQRYFGIDTPLSEKTAQQIWDDANARIAAGGFAPRDLIERSNVVCVCTTDDPADSLEYHALMQKESFSCRVLPAFRPDKALGVELPAFLPWLRALEEAVGAPVDSFSALCDALKSRMELFAKMGCRASDQAFAYVPFSPADSETVEAIFQNARSGKAIGADDADKYRTRLLQFLAEEYCKRGWVMELHIGPMRNNNTKMFRSIGPDAGFDSIGDDAIAYRLSRFLDSMAERDLLPKTVLFTLNPRDNYVIGSMLGNFQTDEAFGKIQFGSGWWFNDHIDGMREQMRTLANLGCLGTFVGMVTDSRSFLSYPRHEYFRRILCGLLGDFVEKGLYPDDTDTLCGIVRGISFENAKTYFDLK